MSASPTISMISATARWIWIFFPVVLLAILLASPQPTFVWEEQVIPAAQRYMEHYYHNDNNSNSNSNSNNQDHHPLTGLVVVNTGSTSGIGLEMTRKISHLGAHVVAIGRSPSKLKQLEEELLNASSVSLGEEAEEDTVGGGGGVITTIVADFTDLESISNAANQIRSSFTTIDMLINNAGIHAPLSGLWNIETTVQGYDLVFGVNYLSHVLLTEKLFPLLQNAPHGRILQVSSGFHSAVDGSDLRIVGKKEEDKEGRTTTTTTFAPIASYPGGSHGFFFFRIQRQYANSKMAQILHARSINRLQEAKAAEVAAAVAAAASTAAQEQQSKPDGEAPISNHTTVRAMSSCPAWVATQIGAANGIVINTIFHTLAFPADGYGLSSIFAGLFHIPTTELESSIETTIKEEESGHQGRRPRHPLSRHRHQLEDFFVNMNFVSYYKGQRKQPWIYSTVPIWDIRMMIGAYCLMLPLQRFYAWIGPMKSSDESYDIQLQDDLYEWSLQAVAPYL